MIGIFACSHQRALVVRIWRKHTTFEKESAFNFWFHANRTTAIKQTRYSIDRIFVLCLPPLYEPSIAAVADRPLNAFYGSEAIVSIPPLP